MAHHKSVYGIFVLLMIVCFSVRYQLALILEYAFSGASRAPSLKNKQDSSFPISQTEWCIVLGNRCAAAGRLEDAITHYQKALEHDARSAQAHLQLSLVFVQQQKYQRAQYHGVKAAEYNPALAQLHRSSPPSPAATGNHYSTTVNVIVPEEYLRQERRAQKMDKGTQPGGITRLPRVAHALLRKRRVC